MAHHQRTALILIIFTIMSSSGSRLPDNFGQVSPIPDPLDEGKPAPSPSPPTPTNQMSINYESNSQPNIPPPRQYTYPQLPSTVQPPTPAQVFPISIPTIQMPSASIFQSFPLLGARDEYQRPIRKTVLQLERYNQTHYIVTNRSVLASRSWTDSLWPFSIDRPFDAFEVKMPTMDHYLNRTVGVIQSAFNVIPGVNQIANNSMSFARWFWPRRR